MTRSVSAKSAWPAPVVLTSGTRWRFRRREATGPGPWAPSIAQALGGVAGRQRAVAWPTAWRVFSRIQAHWPIRSELGPHQRELPTAALAGPLPESLHLDGEQLDRLDLELSGGHLDLAAHFGEARNLRCAWLFAEYTVDRAQELFVHSGADWWHQWFVDGVAVFDTLDHGNGAPLLHTAHRFPLRLAAGTHRLAVRVLSGGAGWAFATSATRELKVRDEKKARNPRTLPGAGLEAERAFTVEDPTAYVGLTFIGEQDSTVQLNGQDLPRPEPGMHYRSIPGLPATLLHRGSNRLSRTWSAAEVAASIGVLGLRPFQHSGDWRRLHSAGSLQGTAATAARIITGPFLGWASASSVSLSCRTSVECAVTLHIANQRLVSQAGLLHQFTVDDLPADKRVPWIMTPGAGRPVRGFASTFPAHAASDTPFDLAIYGDPSPQPQVLALVLARMHAARPDAALALGDLTSDGRHDELWNTEYDDLLPAFFRRTPHLWVLGNHEEGCPIFTRLFALPGGQRDWTTVLAGCRFIGIDGLQDWSAGSERLTWLEQTLSAARERFIVFVNHYPAWSSTPHAGLGADGRPLQRTVREARDTLLPLLAKHRVNLYLNGHAHCYERSLPPEGVTCITTGGAGGFLYPRIDPSGGLNPHMQIFVPRHHWCRLRILSDRLELTAYDLEGAVIDSLSVPGRHGP